VKEQIRDRRISQRRTGVAALGFVHCIDRKKTECINGKLIYFVHDKPLSAGFTRMKSWIEIT
jgi:hypothetical protein